MLHSWFDFISVELHNRKRLRVVTTLFTKQAKHTPKSLLKSDRAYLVR